MRILHLGLVTPDNDGCIDRGFRLNSHEVVRIDWRFAGAHTVNQKIREVADTFRPELVFFQGQGTDVVDKQTFDRLRDVGAFVINWTGDVRGGNSQTGDATDIRWYEAMAPNVGLTLFTNTPDVEAMRALGHKADMLAVGYDDNIFVNRHQERQPQIVFMGNNNGGTFPCSVARREMVTALKAEFGEGFEVYGSQWTMGKPCDFLSSVAIYNRSLIAIGQDHYYRGGYYSDRLLRAMACGCHVIQRHYEGIEEEFPDMLHWRTHEELFHHCHMALLHPDISEGRGKENAEHAKEHCTWKARVKELEQLLTKYR